MKHDHEDPGRTHRGRFASITKGTSGAIERMRRAAIYADGEFPAKVKVLAAMLWSISSRCEPCLRYYAGRARELGASEEELGEFLALANTLGGCIAETWALKAYAAFADGDAGACCDHSGGA